MRKSIRLCKKCLAKAAETDQIDDMCELASKGAWLCPFHSPQCGLVFAIVPQRGKINHGKNLRPVKPN